MGRLGFWEILLIVVVVLLLFGAKRIPEIAKSLAEGVRVFKKNIQDKNATEPTIEKKDEQDSAS